MFIHRHQPTRARTEHNYTFRKRLNDTVIFVICETLNVCLFDCHKFSPVRTLYGNGTRYRVILVAKQHLSRAARVVRFYVGAVEGMCWCSAIYAMLSDG